jgi:hypothetical protein
MAHEEVGDKFEENTSEAAAWATAAHRVGVSGRQNGDDSLPDSADQSQSGHKKPGAAGEVGSKRRRPAEQAQAHEMNDDDSSSIHGDVE